MGEQEKQVYQLINEIRSNVSEVDNLAHGLHELNRRIGVPPPNDKVKAEPPEGKQPDPVTITDRLVHLRNSSNDTMKLLRSAVEDLGQLV